MMEYLNIFILILFTVFMNFINFVFERKRTKIHEEFIKNMKANYLEAITNMQNIYNSSVEANMENAKAIASFHKHESAEIKKAYEAYKDAYEKATKVYEDYLALVSKQETYKLQ